MNGTNNNGSAKNSSAGTHSGTTQAGSSSNAQTGANKGSTSTSSNVTNSSTRPTNGDVNATPTAKSKKAAAPAIDMHELLQSRIAALEGEKVQGGEEDRRSAEEARKTVKGMNLQQVHAKYVELYQEFRRQEREHAKERQKNKKEYDASKTTLTNVQKLKSKTDAVVRDMQKQNKDLRDEAKRLKGSLQQVEQQVGQISSALSQLSSAKDDLQKRMERDKKRDKRYSDMPDIVIKVVCRYRAELFFKISRKTKLARLFSAWTERMDARSYVPSLPDANKKTGDMLPMIERPAPPPMQFLFTHMGRGLEPDQTPEDANMEDGDEILAVEMMDLTSPEVEEIPKPEKLRLQKNWSLDPIETRNSIEAIFDGVVRERLKYLLRQYEIREAHFESVLRTKELEAMISKAKIQEARVELERETEALTAAQQEIEALTKRMKAYQRFGLSLTMHLEECQDEMFTLPKDVDARMRAMQLFDQFQHEITQRFELIPNYEENESDQEASDSALDG